MTSNVPDGEEPMSSKEPTSFCRRGTAHVSALAKGAAAANAALAGNSSSSTASSPRKLDKSQDNLGAIRERPVSAAVSETTKRQEEPAEPLRLWTGRQLETAEAAITDAEGCVHVKKAQLDDMRRIVAEACRAKVPVDSMLGLQRRLGVLEQRHCPRLQAEDRLCDAAFALERLLAQPEHRTYHLGSIGGPAAALGSGIETLELRQALTEARHVNAEPYLIKQSADLLERVAKAENERQSAQTVLNRVLAKGLRTDDDLQQLRVAVNEGRRWGVNTRMAERKLQSLKTTFAFCEATEMDLMETMQGSDREALRESCRQAKMAGVDVAKVNVALERLSELERDDVWLQQVTGDIRRAVASLESEPERFEQLVEVAEGLGNWPRDLDRLVDGGKQTLKRLRHEGLVGPARANPTPIRKEGALHAAVVGKRVHQSTVSSRYSTFSVSSRFSTFSNASDTKEKAAHHRKNAMGPAAFLGTIPDEGGEDSCSNLSFDMVMPTRQALVGFNLPALDNQRSTIVVEQGRRKSQKAQIRSVYGTAPTAGARRGTRRGTQLSVEAGSRRSLFTR